MGLPYLGPPSGFLKTVAGCAGRVRSTADVGAPDTRPAKEVSYDTLLGRGCIWD